MLPTVELCRLCGHGDTKHRFDGTRPRCDSCPDGLCVDGRDGERYRAMIGATSQLLGDVPMS